MMLSKWDVRCVWTIQNETKNIIEDDECDFRHGLSGLNGLVKKKVSIIMGVPGV